MRNSHFSSITDDQAREIGLRAAKYVNLFESLIIDDERQDVMYEKIKEKIIKETINYPQCCQSSTVCILILQK